MGKAKSTATQLARAAVNVPKPAGTFHGVWSGKIASFADSGIMWSVKTDMPAPKENVRVRIWIRGEEIEVTEI